MCTTSVEENSNGRFLHQNLFTSLSCWWLWSIILPTFFLVWNQKTHSVMTVGFDLPHLKYRYNLNSLVEKEKVSIFSLQANHHPLVLLLQKVVFATIFKKKHTWHLVKPFPKSWNSGEINSAWKWSFSLKEKLLLKNQVNPDVLYITWDNLRTSHTVSLGKNI